MTTSKFMRLAIAGAALVAASGAFAQAQTANLAVTANVASVCRLTLSGPMAFGALDPTALTDATTSVVASYQCTTGTRITRFTVGGQANGANGYNSPNNRAMTGVTNGDIIPFSITWTNPAAFTGRGFTAANNATRSVTLNGRIANADYVAAAPDSYSATVAVDISP